MRGLAPGDLERIAPLSERRTNQVYVAGADVLPSQRSEGAAEPSDAVAYINDDRQLDDFLANCRSVDKLENKLSAGNVIRSAVNATSITLPFVKVDLAKWNLQNKITPTSLTNLSHILVREDHLRDVQIAELLEVFGRTEPLRQPQIVFVPNEGSTDLATRLHYANPSISVLELTQTRRRQLQISRSAPVSLADFGDLYERRCFDRAGSVSSRDLNSWFGEDGRVPELIAFGTRVRARLLTAERHHVESDVDAQLQRLDSAIKEARGSELEILLHLRISALLQKLFCSEDAKFLTEAIALASALGDELGLAACLRFAEFLDVHPAFADHMYERAEKTFRAYGSREMAIYCANNRLVAGNTRRLPESRAFEDLLMEIGEHQPALYRRHDILYNAGVRHLLAGDIDRASDVFASPVMAEARPLVLASSRLAISICGQVGGSPPSPEQLIDLVDYVLEAIPRSNRWHITNLLLNASVFARGRIDLMGEIAARAKAVIDLKGPSDVRDVYDENGRLAELLGLHDVTAKHRIPGPFGEFQARYGFLVPYFFIWS